MSTLPHVRYHQFMELVEDYKEMVGLIDIKLCPSSSYRDIQGDSYSIREEDKEADLQVCSWLYFHADKATLKDTGKIVHVIQGQLVDDPLKDTRIGQRKKEERH